VASSIGIKIANGEFYSIMEENLQAKKRLVLTTAHDNQRSVQIDLYKSYTRTMGDALYIGSLVVENIKPRPKGEPSIEMVIASTAEGNITADAIDMDTSPKGEHNTLNVSLKSFDEDTRDYELPDFELETGEPPPSGLYEKARNIRGEEKKSKFPWLAVIGVILIMTAIVLAMWFFLCKNKGDNNAAGTRSEQTQPLPVTQAPVIPPAAPPPAAPAAPAPPPQAATPPPPVTPPVTPPLPPVIQAPAQPPASVAPARRERPAPPVASYKVPAVIPREGVAYKIRWGDTLWDIAQAFYRNPWLYPRIARFNNIRNPDLIISGRTIRVPPRN
jgi:hypothetical protein